MSGENLSPRHTRSGLVICSSRREEETPGSPELGLVPRLRLLGRGIELRRGGTPGSEMGIVPRLSSLLTGTDVVGRPATRQRVGAAQMEDIPEVIDLSDDEGSQEYDEFPVSPIGAAYLERQDISRVEASIPVTPQSRSLMDATIDLTMSPITSSIVPSQTSFTPSSSTAPPSSPSPPAIMCPVCMESISSIRMKGYHLLSTICGHIFCSHCLPECIKHSPTCPTCRRKLSTRDYHQLFLH